MLNLINGKYVGKGVGQHGDYEVEVTIENNRIAAVNVLGDHGNSAYPDNAAGSDVNTICGDSYNYTLPGNAMGFAVNSGRMAGQAVVDQIKG